MWRGTGGHGGTYSDTHGHGGQQQKKSNTTNRAQKTPKPSPTAQQKYNSANQCIIKLSTPKEPHQTRKKTSSTTKQHSKKHNSKTAKLANKLNVAKKNIEGQEMHRGKRRGPRYYVCYQQAQAQQHHWISKSFKAGKQTQPK